MAQPPELQRAGTVHVLGEITNANFPMDPSGRVFHLSVKKGEVAPRILSVGDPRRAEVIARCFDNPNKVFKLVASRGFVTYTGKKNGVPVSIIATGMGMPMMDFVVRECSNVIESPIVIMRFGTCGGLQTTPLGGIAVASKGSVSIRRNPDHWTDPEASPSPYIISKPVKSDPELMALVVQKLKDHGVTKIVEGLNATADSFYSSQGRRDPHFDDQNETILQDLTAKYTEAISLEMETFHLLDLARTYKQGMHAGAACIVLAQRWSNGFLDKKTTEELEHQAGNAILDALSSYPLPSSPLDTAPDAVWNLSDALP